MEQHVLHITVNGTYYAVACDPDTPLLEVLRDDLGLAGPRFGCGAGLCGACFVMVDGRARSCCDYPAWAAHDKQVTTVEGLADDGAMGPVQQAFLDEQAAQCGYCTAGMVVSAAALLRANPAVTEADVRAALEGNLCRCSVQGRIVAAVMKAAARSGSHAAAG